MRTSCIAASLSLWMALALTTELRRASAQPAAPQSPPGKTSTGKTHLAEPLDFEPQPTNFLFVSRCAWQGALSPDEKLLVVGYGHWTEAGEVRVFEVESGKMRFEFPERGGVRSVGFSPDGKLFASSNFVGEVKLRNVKTGKIRREFKEPAGGNRMTFSKDGKLLATTSNGSVVNVRDIESGKVVKSYEGHTALAYWVDFSPDGKNLLSSSGDNTARIWDLKTAEVKHVLTHPATVLAAVYSPDGKKVATACFDRQLRLFETASGELLATLVGHENPLTAVTFSPDGSRVVSGDYVGTIRLWDAAAHESLAAAAEDKTVKLWDMESRKVRTTLSGHTEGVWCLAFSPSGKTLVTAGADKLIKVWDVAPGKEVAKEVATLAAGKEMTVEVGHSAPIPSLAFAPDGSHLLSASLDKSVKVWRARAAQRSSADSIDFRASGEGLRRNEERPLMWLGVRAYRGSRYAAPPGSLATGDVRHDSSNRAPWLTRRGAAGRLQPGGRFLGAHSERGPEGGRAGRWPPERRPPRQARRGGSGRQAAGTLGQSQPLRRRLRW